MNAASNKSVLEGRRATSSGTTKGVNSNIAANVSNLRGATAKNSHQSTVAGYGKATGHGSGLAAEVAAAQSQGNHLNGRLSAPAAAQQSSIREPNKSASTSGVGMYNKDYTTSGSAAPPESTTLSATGGGSRQAAVNRTLTATSQPKAQSSSTMNKSLETVIRKAAYKGIEPLRRRYTAAGQNSSTSASSANGHTSQYSQAALKRQGLS